LVAHWGAWVGRDDNVAASPVCRGCDPSTLPRTIVTSLVELSSYGNPGVSPLELDWWPFWPRKREVLTRFARLGAIQRLHTCEATGAIL